MLRMKQPYFQESTSLHGRRGDLGEVVANAYHQSVEIKIADRPARVRGFFRLLQGLLEFFIENIGGILLRFHGLTENRVTPVVTFFHRLGSFLNVVEHFRRDGCRVRDYSFGTRVNLEQGAAAWTGDFEGLGGLCHHANHTAKSTLWPRGSTETLIEF